MAGTPYVIPARDRMAFLGCRRAWDLGARERGNHRPAMSEVLLDRPTALCHALAVYYFPGMWDWQPGMVLRLVRMAYLDELTAQRDRYLREHGLQQLDSGTEQDWAQARDEGLDLLERYFEWAPSVDELAPVLVGAEFDVQVPDPNEPGRNLISADGRAIHYRDRVDLLVIDGADGYWMVEHRVLPSGFPELGVLRLTERCLSWCWAWELFYPGIRIEGTIFNELRDDGERSTTGPTTPRQRGGVTQHKGTYLRPWSPSEPRFQPEDDLEPVAVENGAFRRVVVPRARAELAAFGDRIAGQVREMAIASMACHPTPGEVRCAKCEFRAPCLSMNLGEDPAGLLAAGYVQRSQEPRPAQLGGGTWSSGRAAAPPREFGGP